MLAANANFDSVKWIAEFVGVLQDDMDVPALDLLASAGLDFDPDELDNLLEQDDNDVIDV